MIQKRTVSSSKRTWQAIRRRYTWHLRPPFDSEFDRSHWWKGTSTIESESSAALYELARRHPLIREHWLRKIAAINQRRRGVAIWLPEIRTTWVKKLDMPYGDSSPPTSLYWTCCFALKSWAKLDWTDQRNWESSVGSMKGLDFRNEDEQCRCIRIFAHWSILDQRKEALKDGSKTAEELRQLVRKDLRTNPPTGAEWEAAIAQRAVEAHRQGYVLLAVPPDLTADNLESVVAKKYREHLALYPQTRPKQRARPEDWLALISEFEDAEASPQKAKSQIFARYRRALDAVHFT